MQTELPSRSGFLPARVIHLHPSRFCNLACQHCYSSSGPHLRRELSPELIFNALVRLRLEGYDVVSLSGGEPLLYSGFERVVENAVELGFRVNLISNGAVLSRRIAKFIAQNVNLVAISLDGGPETHAAMRGDANAFKQGERAMDRLAAEGVRFGISYCLSQKSLSEMPWVIDFAAEKGAALVQFHPLAATGRANATSLNLGLAQSDMRRAYVLAELLKSEEGPAIQLDLAPVAAVHAHRSDYKLLQIQDAEDLPLSDLVNPLIVDETGLLFPYCYGINSHYALGRTGNNLDADIVTYKQDKWRALADLLNASFENLGSDQNQFVDWFYHLAQTSLMHI